jgi:hypothetical protein
LDFIGLDVPVRRGVRDDKKPGLRAFFAGIIGIYLIDETLAGGGGHN